MKLYSHYSLDECNDEDALFEKLDELQDVSKIHYRKEDAKLLKITDIDLTESEEQDLIKFFESLDLYPFMDDDTYDDFYEDDEDDYTSRGRGRRSSLDDYDDF